MGKVRARTRCWPQGWTVGSLLVALALPAAAQDVSGLITYRPDNRAGDAAMVIAEMIAERSESTAVRDRARSISGDGTLQLTAEEILVEIGAHSMIAGLDSNHVGSNAPVALPVALPQPAAIPVTTQPPEVKRVTVAPSVAPSATPAQQSTRRNWSTGSGFSSAVDDRGGGASAGGGGGGSRGGSSGSSDGAGSGGGTDGGGAGAQGMSVN